MILKRFILLIAFVWGTAAAQAATLSDVTAVVGGPTINDSAGTVSVSPFGVSYTGSVGALASTGASFSVLQADFNGLPNLFVAQSLPTLSITPAGPVIGLPSPLLLGTAIDVADGTGFIQALFSTTGGSLAPQFGTLFRLTLSNSLFTDTTLDPGAPDLVTGNDTVALVEAVAAPNVIPLPAGIWLMLGGIGGLLTLRKRSQASVAA